MAKLDLGIINEPGHGRPVPKEFDLHMVKYVIGQRKEAIERDKSLFQYPWDQSDVFILLGRTSIN